MAKIGSAVALLSARTAQDVLPVCDLNLPKGTVMEVIGSRSSGRTAFLHAILAASVALGETCAVIDATDSFDPASAAANGVSLDRIFWVQCSGRADHAVKAADWIIHAGGFGVVMLDLCEVAPEILRKIPFSLWYQYRNAVENTHTMCVVIADQHLTGSCATRIFAMDRGRLIWSGSLLEGIETTVASRKPVAAKSARYEARVAG
jgi:hypothetical protein